MGSLATREQTLRELAQLNAEVPEMRRRFFEPGAFMGQFAVRAELICESARPEDADWVFDQLDAILDKHGVVNEKTR